MKRKTILILGGIPIVLVGAGLIAVVLSEQSAERRIAAAKAELKAMGYPTTREEFQALAPSSAENAAPFYEKVMPDFGRSPLSRLNNAGWSTDHFIKASDADVALLDRMDQVRLRSRLWIESGIDAQTIRRMADTLGRRAVLETHRGNTKRALERFQTITAIADHLIGAQDHYVAQTGRWIIAARNLSAIEAGTVNGDLKFLKALRAMAETRPEPLDIKRYLGVEAVALSRPSPPWQVQDAEGFALTQPFMLKRLQANQLEVLVALAKASQDGLTEAEKDEVAKLEVDHYMREFRFASHPHRRLSMLSSVLRDRDVPLPNVLVGLDYLIQLAGGPKVVVPKGLKLDVDPAKPSDFMVLDYEGHLNVYDRVWYVHGMGLRELEEE